ncbi:MAG: DNA repair protein RecN [Lentisphaerae bacterium]|nr:DNA repair protein RecN [Lentisphaerota bacterium]
MKNLAIVENIRVDFGKGLNVITGETGAGKSIVVGALGLVLGERADRGLIRSGETQCGVEAVFQLADSADVDAVLEDLGIEPCEDGVLVLRRIVAASGSGKVLVNDAPATVQALRRIGDLLVDMHGPHDHQSLLNPDFQRDLLDSFGHLWKLRAAYEDAHGAVRELEQRRAALEGDDGDTAEQIELLSYRVKEIAAAELTPETEAELEREHIRVANAQRILELAEGIRNALSEGEGSACDGASAAGNALDELAGLLDDAAPWRDEARAAAVQLRELSDSVEQATRDVEGDPERLQWLEDRLALVHKLKRKYGGSVAAVLETAERAQTRLDDLASRGERLAEIAKAQAAACGARDKTGLALRQAREKAAGALAEAITRELQDLGFPHGAFAVGLTPVEPQAGGMDAVEFGFAPNVGEAMRSLRAIASSGEISRVMLAVKAVLAAHDRIPVLVFDEIDANVGGETGNAVGEKLAAVAANHQVLCITHLPQVAVYGATHFEVSKHVQAGRTRTGIAALDAHAREEEIARMLGGRGPTRTSLQHARELLREGSG